MTTLEMLHELFKTGYHFVYDPYYGGDEVEDFEEVEELWVEVKEDFDYEIHHDRRLVFVGIKDKE